MSWVTVGVTAAGIGAGVLKGREEQKAHRRRQLAEAEKTRYSPWTGVTGQTLAPPSSVFGSALQGGVAGATLGQGIGNLVQQRNAQGMEQQVQQAPKQAAVQPPTIQPSSVYSQQMQPQQNYVMARQNQGNWWSQM